MAFDLDTSTYQVVSPLCQGVYLLYFFIPQTDYVRKALNECQLLLFLLPAGMTNKDWQGEQVCREDGGIMPYIMDHAKPLPPPSGETIARRNLRTRFVPAFLLSGGE